MASPVSFGDAYLAAQLCFRIAQAFTSGRKSAPAEFREVENQLYSLNAALEGIRDASKAGPRLWPGASASWGSVDDIVKNCGETLKHLEGIVNKYAVIKDERDPTKPVFRQWKADVSKNWKKIAWTKEKGDLASLRNQIAVHANSLNLVLATMTNSQTGRIEDQVGRSSQMLEEIYAWYKDNLRDTVPLEKKTSFESSDGESTTTALPPHFELHLETDRGLRLVCPRTCLTLDSASIPRIGSSSREQLDDISPFSCICSLNGNGPQHQASVGSYQMAHTTFPIRTGGSEMEWVIHNAADASSSRLVSLHIRRVPATFIAEFEESFIRPLAMRGAREIIRDGEGTMMAYVQPGAQREDRVRLLSVASDLDRVQPLVDSVTFTSGQRSYSRDSIDSVSMLHYSTLVDVAAGALASHDVRTLLPMPYGEILITFEDDDDAPASSDDLQALVLLKHNTQLRLIREDATLRLESVACSSSASGLNDKHNVMDVTFQLTTPEAATELHKRVEEMRMELFVLSLQHPQDGEEAVLHLQVKQVQCEDVFIPEAALTILRNANTGRYRMIIATRDRRITLSQNISQDFFDGQRPKAGDGGGGPTPPMWLVQFEEAGRRRVYRYQSGVRGLSFRDARSNKVLELARHAISRSPPLRAPG